MSTKTARKRLSENDCTVLQQLDYKSGEPHWVREDTARKLQKRGFVDFTGTSSGHPFIPCIATAEGLEVIGVDLGDYMKRCDYRDKLNARTVVCKAIEAVVELDGPIEYRDRVHAATHIMRKLDAAGFDIVKRED